MTESDTCMNKPDLFTYHDHIHFLNDWFKYLKKTKSGFSMRTLAHKSQIAVGYISMIFRRERELSEKSFHKMLPQLFLNDQEKSFLDLLRIVGQSPDPQARVEAVQKMSKLKSFKTKNNNDVRIYEYLTKWFYVAIYEMIALENFKMDAKWVQSRLNRKLSLSEINSAFDFLKNQEFIKLGMAGKWVQTKSHLDCREGIFKLSLGEFHRQMLALAADAIEKTPREQRLIMGQTMSISAKDFEKIKVIIQESVQKINEVGSNSDSKNNVYHIELAAFPLTKIIKYEDQDEE